jgi:PPIC-type PPIASE domain
MQASHLLVKHKDVRNPKSWKEAQVTRTKEEALEKINGFHKDLTSGDPATLPQRFAELASQESHCSSAKRGGDLGPFRCTASCLSAPCSQSCLTSTVTATAMPLSCYMPERHVRRVACRATF